MFFNIVFKTICKFIYFASPSCSLFKQN